MLFNRPLHLDQLFFHDVRFAIAFTLKHKGPRLTGAKMASKNSTYHSDIEVIPNKQHLLFRNRHLVG